VGIAGMWGDVRANQIDGGANDGDSPSRSTHLSCSTILFIYHVLLVRLNSAQRFD
jgi:hypothetical protein